MAATKHISDLNPGVPTLTSVIPGDNAAGNATFKHTINSVVDLADVPPYDVGTTGGSVTLDRANGITQKLTLNGAITLLPPANGSIGKQLRLWIIVDGSARNLTMDAGILLPSDSALTWPKSLTASKLYTVLLQHNGSNWMLISLVGGY